MGESLTKMRRKDREITNKDWIIALLNRADYGVLATCKDGQVFTVARNFVYDAEKHAVYFHGARQGRTFEQAEAGTKANLNVSEIGEWLLAKRAMNFGVTYKGVVIFGTLSVVDDVAEAKRGLQLLMDKHFPNLRPNADYEAITDNDLKVTAVIRMDIDSWSGKEKKD
ncbi:MAG TPA: pyridoxamine 5'-phosphate oxidase family protein [Anaerolineales bacterium]|nr:pyridoxamine 5'-phosphate oxidase family protein [Anaerolineales bacterium]